MLEISIESYLQELAQQQMLLDQFTLNPTLKAMVESNITLLNEKIQELLAAHPQPATLFGPHPAWDEKLNSSLENVHYSRQLIKNNLPVDEQVRYGQSCQLIQLCFEILHTEQTMVKSVHRINFPLFRVLIQEKIKDRNDREFMLNTLSTLESINKCFTIRLTDF